MVENSSMQQMPPSARTNAPASSTKSGPSRTAAQVSPALVHPRPLVRTLLLPSSWAAWSNWDLPVPGSPSSSRCGVVRRCGCWLPPPSPPPAAGPGVPPGPPTPLPPAAQLVAGVVPRPPGSDGRKRVHFCSCPAPPPDAASPGGGGTAGEPPMSVNRSASFGTGMPLSQGAVAWMSSWRTCHSLLRFKAHSFTNSSPPVPLVWIECTADSLDKRSTWVASMNSSTSNLLPCQRDFQRWCTTPSSATVSPG
mmetsp:Transcript_1567/g.4311  ORF Transcript_1567/g.4311 Transcript_1567/m.4311 type:complete len:251 (-) Transcript_1567:389-1141(-)